MARHLQGVGAVEASLKIIAVTGAAVLSVALTACSAETADPCAPSGLTAKVHVHVASNTGVLGAPGARPAWIAYQNGSCPWQEVADPSGDGEYELPVTALAYGVAVECADPDLMSDIPARLQVKLLTVAETTDVDFSCPHLQNGVQGHAIGAVFGDTIDKVLRLYLRDDDTGWQFVGQGAGTVGIGWMAASGTYDVALARGEWDPVANMESIPTAVKILRERTAGPEDDYVPVDVTDPDWAPFDPEEALSVTAAMDTDYSGLDAAYVTRWGTSLPLATGGFTSDEPLALTFPTIPAAVSAAGDAYRLTYSGYTADDHDRRISRFTTALPPAPLELPPRLGLQSLAVEHGKTVWRFAAIPGGRLYAIVQDADRDTGRPATAVEVSAGRLPEDGAAEIELPDFEDLPGFSDAWRASDGADWHAIAFGNDGGWPAAALFDSIGEDPGAPADLDGLAFWTSASPVTHGAP
jgi:hypothetical protein